MGFSTNSLPYTDYYRAPELALRPVSLVLYPTLESDVYAYGCLLLEVSCMPSLIAVRDL